MSEPTPAPYAELLAKLREAELFASVNGILSWDQETRMPPAAAALRADQIALVSTLVHNLRTDERIGELIAASEADPGLARDPRTAANLREIRREYEHAVKLPVSLVRELAETTSLALQAWREAREKNDFPAFAPWLEKVVRLTRAKAECYGGDPYDALLDEYEPGATAAQLEAVFVELRTHLTPLIAQIAEAARRPDDRVHRLRVPVARQEALNLAVAGRIGFDLSAGRLDTSTHPFCTGIGPGDTRLTTRYQEEGFPDSLSSTMHEAGHGLYEQGLPKAEYPGQPLSEAASLGIHESQSRLWENLVGRSREFWEWALPEARRHFGDALDGVGVDEVYGAVNLVRPNLIRVDSDEATYNLHIMLRFDLERALLDGGLAVGELPGAWNERIRADLGMDVPDDRRGCLQDIHWSMGAIGYFPTYTLGNLYAAQFWEAITREIPGLGARIEQGDFSGLLGWLRSRIHARGRELPALALCEAATGAPLSAAPFVRYLEGKLRPLYGI